MSFPSPSPLTFSRPLCSLLPLCLIPPSGCFPAASSAPSWPPLHPGPLPASEPCLPFELRPQPRPHRNAVHLPPTPPLRVLAPSLGGRTHVHHGDPHPGDPHCCSHPLPAWPWGAAWLSGVLAEEQGDAETQKTYPANLLHLPASGERGDGVPSLGMTHGCPPLSVEPGHLWPQLPPLAPTFREKVDLHLWPQH